jgi:hypothetical protein
MSPRCVAAARAAVLVFPGMADEGDVHVGLSLHVPEIGRGAGSGDAGEAHFPIGSPRCPLPTAVCDQPIGHSPEHRCSPEGIQA